MRRYLKRDILSLLYTMEKARKVLNNEIKKGNFDVANHILKDCQEGVIEIKDIVRETEGKEVNTIHMIEKYCKIIHELNQAFAMNISPKNTLKEFQKQSYRIINSVKYDIPEAKTEIAFLPYKYSMWDSMESIWMAAKEDSNCNTYVIPIPYYDRNADGSFGEMHYEGNELPEYVPITNWKEYDIKKRHPDIIYFHNPYDEFNLVTSVHPDFYSKKLKNYTELLVYSSYYILGTVGTEEEFLNKIRLPGIIYADKVILQSKVLYDLYLKYGFESEKLLLCGSPKIDAFVNLKKENIEIPQEWLDKIGDKKVIALNSSIKNLLNSDNYLDNLEILLEELTSKEGIVLLWRPHPLLKQTVLSMKNHWIERYENIEQRIMRKSNFILDSTLDNKIATIISDGMVSDVSSWTIEYLATGKPVLYIYGRKKDFEEYFLPFDEHIAYFIEDGMNIDMFCQKIIENRDDERDKRLKELDTLMENMDGTCGKKVHNLIMEEEIQRTLDSHIE
ncbi:MAG: hypothetical protein GX308_04830 [Epulopiscium sp.]|nr:hypothetical protein [Candidatus Epulonipiscium sp.]